MVPPHTRVSLRALRVCTGTPVPHELTSWLNWTWDECKAGPARRHAVIVHIVRQLRVQHRIRRRPEGQLLLHEHPRPLADLRQALLLCWLQLSVTPM